MHTHITHTQLPSTDARKQKKNIPLRYLEPQEASSLVSFSFDEASPSAVLIDATIGATAGAGAVDLLILAACNL